MVLYVEWPCDTHKQVDELYAVIDQGRPRTFKDGARVYGLSEVLPESWVSPLGSAVMMIHFRWEQENKNKTVDIQDHIGMAFEYVDATMLYRECIRGVDRVLRNVFVRRSTMSVALATLRFSRERVAEKAEQFWRGIAEDDGLRKNDARRVVRDHLERVYIAGGDGGKMHISGEMMSSYKSARVIANCWNAWVEERTMEFAKPNENLPIRIAMTPWDKPQRA